MLDRNYLGITDLFCCVLSLPVWGFFFCFACVWCLLLQVALQNKIKLPDCLDFIKEARAQGLTIPVVLMGR